MRRQSGVALITALLIVALATATAVAVSLRSSLRLRGAENAQAYVQAVQTARAGIDFARWALRQDQVSDSRSGTPIDALTEPWAQSLPPFPVEGGSVAGAIHDAQGAINLNNLGLSTGSGAGSHSPIDLLILQALLAQNNLDPALANALADFVDPDSEVTLPGGAEDVDYLALNPARRAANRPLENVDELIQVRGFTPAAVAALRPYVCALPVHTPVNINTAPAAVIAALFQVSASDAEALLEVRSASPFIGQGDLLLRAPAGIKKRLTEASAGTTAGGAGATATAIPQPQTDYDVKSQYFQIDAHATYAKVQYGLSALVRREQTPVYPTILWERRTLF